MSLDLKTSVTLIATLGSGLLAGMLIEAALSAKAANSLSEGCWVSRFQLEDRLFSRVMPALMLSAFLALIAASVLRRGQARLLFGTGALFLLVVLSVSVALQVPLNKQVQAWTPSSVPAGWQQIRDLWFCRHVLRTVFAAIGFVCSLIALALD